MYIPLSRVLETCFTEKIVWYKSNIPYNKIKLNDYIDLITKLLIELVTDNGPDSEGYHTIERLGFPKSEPINDNDRVDEEEEEGDY